MSNDLLGTVRAALQEFADAGPARLPTGINEHFERAYTHLQFNAEVWLHALVARVEQAEADLATLRHDAAQFCGDNERLLKALNCETVDGAMHHIAALKQTVVAREEQITTLRDRHVAEAARFKGLLHSAHGALADASTVPVPRAWDDPIDEAIWCLTRKRDTARAEAAAAGIGRDIYCKRAYFFEAEAARLRERWARMKDYADYDLWADDKALSTQGRRLRAKLAALEETP